MPLQETHPPVFPRWSRACQSTIRRDIQLPSGEYPNIPTVSIVGLALILVGIGAMGTPMSTNLAKAGYKIVAYDTDPKRTQALASTLEIEVAGSLEEVGAMCGTVITMLPDGKIARNSTPETKECPG